LSDRNTVIPITPELGRKQVGWHEPTNQPHVDCAESDRAASTSRLVASSIPVKLTAAPNRLRGTAGHILQRARQSVSELAYVVDRGHIQYAGRLSLAVRPTPPAPHQ
jgi:hypothetical protein